MLAVSVFVLSWNPLHVGPQRGNTPATASLDRRALLAGALGAAANGLFVHPASAIVESSNPANNYYVRAGLVYSNALVPRSVLQSRARPRLFCLDLS